MRQVKCIFAKSYAHALVLFYLPLSGGCCLLFLGFLLCCPFGLGFNCELFVVLMAGNGLFCLLNAQINVGMFTVVLFLWIFVHFFDKKLKIKV
jgi:hypothetical protein